MEINCTRVYIRCFVIIELFLFHYCQFKKKFVFPKLLVPCGQLLAEVNIPPFSSVQFSQLPQRGFLRGRGSWYNGYAYTGKDISDLFRLCPPVRYAPPPPPPVTEHVPLHNKSLCKNMTRASGGANNMRPLSWGGGGRNGKDPTYHMILTSFDSSK